MVANASAVQLAPLDLLHDLLERMTLLAGDGDWDGLESAVDQVCRIVPLVPPNERAGAIEAAQHCLADIEAAARGAHDDVTDRLTTLRRGQDASRAYGSARNSLESGTRS